MKIQAALYCRTVRMQDLNYFERKYKNLKQIKYIGSRIVRYPSATGFTNGSGYSSDNQFDYRMSYDAPPHFTEPVNSGWEVKAGERFQARAATIETCISFIQINHISLMLKSFFFYYSSFSNH